MVTGEVSFREPPKRACSYPAMYSSPMSRVMSFWSISMCTYAEIDMLGGLAKSGEFATAALSILVLKRIIRNGIIEIICDLVNKARGKTPLNTSSPYR